MASSSPPPRKRAAKTPKKARHEPGTVRGRFSLSSRGFGFVMPESEEGESLGEDLFVPPNATLGAVTNDLVLARITGKGRKGYQARVVEILERGQVRFVGTYLGTPEGRSSGPTAASSSRTSRCPTPPAPAPSPRTRSSSRCSSTPSAASPARPSSSRSSARAAPGVDTLTIIRQFELPDKFSEEVMADARRAAERMNDEALAGRKDLTADTIITIDPVDARDFDDAISLLEHKDGTATLGVHIADVSTFVEEGAALDLEARERSTSVYLPGTVVPMLPEILSNGVCSLQEGRTRLTKSVFIHLDRDGRPQEVELANSFIKSARRLTYEQAMAALEGKGADLPSEVVGLLIRMDRWRRKLLDRRRREGYLELDIPDVDLELDDEGKVVAAHPEDTSFTHKIIEMFMVEANEAVARALEGRGLTFIRRIHPEPGDEAAEDLQHYATSIGCKLADARDRHELQALCNRVRGTPEAYGIHLAVLRSLKRAEYSIRPEGHYALASKAYCHFTSPIRRYPDLTVHRLFGQVAGGEAAKVKGGRHKAHGPDAPGADGKKAVAAVAAHACKMERRAEDAERELVKVKLLEYLEHHIGETFTGIITGVQEFGAFVENPEWLIDGLVHITNLKDDQYKFDRRKWALVGQHSGRTLRVGSKLEVRIARISIPRRQLDLEPVEAQGERPRRRPVADKRRPG